MVQIFSLFLQLVIAILNREKSNCQQTIIVVVINNDNNKTL